MEKKNISGSRIDKSVTEKTGLYSYKNSSQKELAQKELAQKELAHKKLAEAPVNFFSYYHRLCHNPSQENSNTQLPPIIEVENLSFSWRHKAVADRRSGNKTFVRTHKQAEAQKNSIIDATSFKLHEGELMSIYGDTGCGKTTLALLFSGRLATYHGSIKLMGKEARTLTVRDKSIVQMMPQVPLLSFNPMLSISDSFRDAYKEFAIRIGTLGVAPGECKQIFFACIETLCAELDIDAKILSRLPSEVSGGQLQRCALIRALLVFPRALILDEPVSHLDIQIRKVSLETIQFIREHTGISIILISHLPEVHAFFSGDASYIKSRISQGSLVF